MAGSFAEACAIIASVNPGGIGAMATAFRALGTAAGTAGGTLAGSAETVGAQHGEPYAAYESRLAPVADWVRNLNQPATSTAASLDNAQNAAVTAQFVMAQQQAALARYGVSMAGRDPASAAAAMAAAEAQALAVLNGEIAKMTAAFGAVQPPDPGTAPVHGGGGGGTRTGPNATTGATATAMLAGTGGAGGNGVTSNTGMPTGPESGPFAGWVKDPTTGNLIDPATGREVDSSGRFVDPVTGQPFGDPSQYASRLEGLQGGVSPALGGGPGSVPLAPAFSAPAPGGPAGFAPFYGGMIPPSLMGTNPAGAQLRQRAAQNLALRAETAQRFNAIASGNPSAVPATRRGVRPGGSGCRVRHGYLSSDGRRDGAHGHGCGHRRARWQARWQTDGLGAGERLGRHRTGHPWQGEGAVDGPHRGRGGRRRVDRRVHRCRPRGARRSLSSSSPASGWGR